MEDSNLTEVHSLNFCLVFAQKTNYSERQLNEKQYEKNRNSIYGSRFWKFNNGGHIPVGQ